MSHPESIFLPVSEIECFVKKLGYFFVEFVATMFSEAAVAENEEVLGL